MRGHNIVADGWAGTSNPHPLPNPPPKLKRIQKVSKTLIFNSITMTDQWTDGQTDKASYRVASPRLKTSVWTLDTFRVCLCLVDGIWGIDGGMTPLPTRPQRYRDPA